MFAARRFAPILASGLAVASLAACVQNTAATTPDDTGTQAQPQPPASPIGADLAPYYDQTLTWRDCEGGGFECTDLTVPLDYDNPAVGDTAVAVLRSKGERPNGSLVLNPGGPGGSGVDYARAATSVLSPEVVEAYTIVGFDPRGVGRSSPIDCVSDRQLDRWIAADADPQTEAEQAELLTSAQRFGKRCDRRSGRLLPYVGTAAVVQDMEVLRAALGEPRLNYLGFSYGTLLGARYADQFGPTTGRMVLDGILPPQLDAEAVGLGQAKGFEDALRRFVADCQEQSDCPVGGGSVDAGVAQIQRFLADLETAPLPTESGRDLTQSLALGAILYHLYFPFSGDWQQLSAGLRDAFAGDGTRLLEAYELRLERSPDGSYRNNSQEAFFAVNCLDRPSGQTATDFAERAEAWAQEAPTFGRYLAWSEAACSQWPVAGEERARSVTAGDAGPILVIGNEHDPATPLQWAQLLADSLADAHLIVWGADGHTAYRKGSSCVDDAVDGYLLEGALPADNPLQCS